MDLHIQIKMNPHLFLRDPESSELGRKIIQHAITMIREIGFEDFTFKKLAIGVGTTEASIYRYFENKHKLLTYIICWYWAWMEYQLIFHTNNIDNPEKKIAIIMRLITLEEDNTFLAHINKDDLHYIVISEGNKAYLTRHVTEDNQVRLFKPYKDLCKGIADIFLEVNPAYQFPHSLASTLIETAHHQMYFKDHLPSLTDFFKDTDKTKISKFLTDLVMKALIS